MILTEYKKRKYLRSSNKCPYCGSENITTTENVQVDADGGSQDVMCEDCEREWVDIYKLVDILEREE